MPNRYPHFDFGRWDTFPNNVENIKELTTTLATLQRSADVARNGGFSGKVTFTAFKTNPAYYGPNLYLNFVKYISGPREFLTVFGPADAGKEFLLEAWIYTPSSNPIGSDDLSIQIGPMVTTFHGVNSGGIISPISVVSKQVSEFKDQWAKIEYRFIMQNGNGFYISAYADDSTLRVGDLPPQLNPNFVGTLNIGGVIYFDDVVLTDLSALACDLAPGVPAYNKTNETATDANDGTITLNAGSSYSRLYSINNVDFFISNLFSGLAPGAYTGYVKDTNPTGCSIEIPGIVISEFVPPPDPPDPPEPGPLLVDAKPVNMNNFVSWFATEGPVVFTEIIFSNCSWDLANGYQVNKRKRKHFPIVVNNEEFAFYLNLETPYNDPNFADFRLHLIDNFGVVQSNIAPLQRHFLPDDVVNYNMYAAVTLAAVPIGKYRLAIVNNSLGSVLLISNEIEVMTSDESKLYSNRIQFRTSFNCYKYYYLLVPEYLNKIRLRLYKIDQQSDGDLEQYRAVSSGVLRNTSIELDRIKTFESYFFDDLANNAMEILVIHDTLAVNGILFIAKGLFKADYVVSNNVNKGKVELYEQDFSTQNRYGIAGGELISGPPLLLGDGGGRIKL